MYSIKLVENLLHSFQFFIWWLVSRNHGPQLYRKSKRSSWNEENLKNALEQVKSNAMSVKKASNIYSIPRTTLTRHLKKKVASPGKINLGCFRIVFSKEVEEDLVKYIKNMQIRFFGLTRDAVFVSV